MNNEHPLSQDLTKLSDDDLDKKYNEVSRRWQIAKRMGMDQYVIHQLDIILDGIEAEKYNRMQMTDDGKTVVLETDPIPSDKKDSKK